MVDQNKADDESVTIDVEFDGKSWKFSGQIRLACIMSILASIGAYYAL